MFKFSSRSKKNLEGVHPDLKAVMNEAIKNSPYDFTITEGVRTAETQKEYYAKGRTKPGVKVTYVDGVTKKSEHQVKADGYGYAVDLYPYFNGSVHTEGAEVDVRLRMIAKHIKEVAKKMNINIQWGGDWKKFVDTPHFQLQK